jgi:purine catabolism regulator
VQTGEPVVADAPALAPRLRDRVLTALAADPDGAQRVLRLTWAGSAVHVLPVPTRHATAIVVTGPPSRPMSLRLLEHAATLAALEVDRVWAVRESELRRGQELFSDLVDGRAPAAPVRAHLAAQGAADGPLAIVAVGDRDEAGDVWHRWLATHGIGHLLLARGDIVYALLPGDAATLDAVLEPQRPWLPAGVSDPLHGEHLDRVHDALRESRWALTTAAERGLPHARYGAHGDVFGARSIREAVEAVERVLAAVIAYDREHGTQLIASLAAFLAHNRSWQAASEALFVHKKTLVYRMRRVEQLTGRSLADVDDVVELWLALRALRRIERE